MARYKKNEPLYDKHGYLLCGAKKKNGDRCQLKAGQATQHPGTGSCKHHGGSTKMGIKNAALANLHLLTGKEIDISPSDALLMCVRIAAAEVTFFTNKLLEMSEDTELIGQPVKDAIASTKDDWEIVELKLPVEMNVWFRAREKSVDNLARYSAMALKAGVEERLVNLAENVGERLATAIEGILDSLNLSKDQQDLVPAAVRKHLTLMETAG